jgi:hypothetical protein
MLEITRDLVEHYLRATGWNRLGGDPVVFRSTNAEYDIVLLSDSIQRSIQYIASASKTPRHVVAFRLGLCAAAESLLAEARVVNESIARGGPVVDEYDERVGSMRFVASQMEAADSILALAGIDAATWESARKR